MAINLQYPTVQGIQTSGQPLIANTAPVLIAGTDGISVYQILTDTAGSQLISGRAADSAVRTGYPVLIGGGGIPSDGAAGDVNAYYIGVNAAHQVSVNTEGKKTTYSASASIFAPVANPTDFWNMFGSATKTIRITRIEVSGSSTAATAATLTLQLVKRSTIGTIGSAVLTPLTAVPHDSGNAAGTAVVNTVGTANYTTVGTLVGQIQARMFSFTLTPFTATDFPECVPTVFDFTNRNEQGIVLRGVTQQVALLFNGAPAMPAGALFNINITYTEE